MDSTMPHDRLNTRTLATLRARRRKAATAPADPALAAIAQALRMQTAILEQALKAVRDMHRTYIQRGH